MAKFSRQSVCIDEKAIFPANFTIHAVRKFGLARITKYQVPYLFLFECLLCIVKIMLTIMVKWLAWGAPDVMGNSSDVMELNIILNDLLWR